ELLASLGNRVTPVVQPHFDEFTEAFTDLFSALAAAKPVPYGRETELRPIVRYLRERARSFDSGRLAASHQAVQAGAGNWATQFQDFDIVVQPTITQLPAQVGSLRDDADPRSELHAMTLFTG